MLIQQILLITKFTAEGNEVPVIWLVTENKTGPANEMPGYNIEC